MKSNSIRFVGDQVLIPATMFYCVVLRPSGLALMGHNSQLEAEDMAKTINAMISDYDCLGYVEHAEVVVASELMPKRRKRASKVSLANVG